MDLKDQIDQSLIVTLSEEKFPSTNFQLMSFVKFSTYLALAFL